MKKVIKFAKEFSPSIIALTLPLVSFAQPTGPSAPTQSSVPQATSITSLQAVLNTMCVVFSWAFYFLLVIAVIMIIVAAFRYIAAAGNPENVKKAGTTLLYAAVAVGVALLARAIPLIVASFLGTTVTSC